MTLSFLSFANEVKFNVSPNVGVYSVIGTVGSFNDYGIVLAGSFQRKLTDHVNINASLGGVYSINDNLAFPSFSVGGSYRLNESIIIGMELPVLPQVFVTIHNKHKITLSILPYPIYHELVFNVGVTYGVWLR